MSMDNPYGMRVYKVSAGYVVRVGDEEHTVTDESVVFVGLGEMYVTELKWHRILREIEKQDG